MKKLTNQKEFLAQILKFLKRILKIQGKSIFCNSTFIKVSDFKNQKKGNVSKVHLVFIFNIYKNKINKRQNH